jgi:hypothetical protein
MMMHILDNSIEKHVCNRCTCMYYDKSFNNRCSECFIALKNKTCLSYLYKFEEINESSLNRERIRYFNI